MEVNASTVQKGITIAGVEGLQVPQPFAAGHKANENEAHALNQLVQENVRNNLRTRIEGLKKDGQLTVAAAEVQKIVTEYCTNYEFGQRGGGGFRTTDPVEAEMLDSARKKVKRALVKGGFKLKDISAADITEKARSLMTHAKYGPKLRADAEKLVKQRDADLDDVIGALGATA